MTSLTINKTGRIELDRSVKATSISLKTITLYLSFYNLTEVTSYTYNGRTTTIQPGYYTYEQLLSKLPGSFKVHQNTLKVSTDATITGGLAKLIENEYLYLTPLCLYLYIDGIDTSKDLWNGKRSNLLSIIPIGRTDVGEIIQHHPTNNYKSMLIGELNSLNVSISDERGNAYPGKFIAELELS